MIYSSPNRNTFINEARGIASGQYANQTDNYAAKMPEIQRVQAVMSSYDGIFKTSYKFPPYNPDALIGQQGYDKMEDMLKMGACWSAFNLKRYSVLKDDWSVEPAISDPLAPDHEICKFYADSYRFCLDNIRDTEVDLPQMFTSVLFDTLLSEWLGYRVAEIQYRDFEPQEAPDGMEGKYGFMGFWAKTNKQIGFDIDQKTLNPKRFVSYTPDGGYDADIHPEKVIYYGHAQSGNDPFGQGDARRVYPNWFQLGQFQKIWAMTLERWGAPVFIAKIPAGNTGEAQAALDVMAMIRNGGFAAIPNNVDYELVTAPTNIFAGLEACCDWNVKQIQLAINSSHLTQGEGKHGATSAGSDEHGETSATVYDYLSRQIENVFNQQLTRRWMKYNWGMKSLRFAPKLRLRKSEETADLFSTAQAMNLLVSMGNMPATSKVIREQMGVPPIDADEDKLLEEQKKANEEAEQRVANAKLSAKSPVKMSTYDDEESIRLVTRAIMAREELKRIGEAA